MLAFREFMCVVHPHLTDSTHKISSIYGDDEPKNFFSVELAETACFGSSVTCLMRNRTMSINQTDTKFQIFTSSSAHDKLMIDFMRVNEPILSTNDE